MPKFIYTLLLFVISSGVASAQMWNGSDTLYGNEWIKPGREYFKIKITEDGIYRIDYQVLLDGGFPVQNVAAERFQLFHLGAETPVFTSTAGMFTGADFIEFYGRKNRDELDRFLFQNPDDELFNPEFSLFSDTAVYYLSWGDAASSARVRNLTNDISNPPAAEQFCQNERSQVFSTTSIYKKYASDLVAYSNFDAGEGFASAYLQKHTLNFNFPPSVQTTGEGIFEIRLATNGNARHDLSIKMNGAEVLRDTTFSIYEMRALRLPVPENLLRGNLQITVEGTSGSNDRYAVSVAKIFFNQSFDFENLDEKAFSLPAGSQPRYLEIQNFDTTVAPPVLYNLKENWRVVTQVENGRIRALLPPADSSAYLLVQTSKAVIKVTSLERPEFSDFLADKDADYIIITHPAMEAPVQNQNQVQAYADYRRSAEGGSHRVAVVNIFDVYESFSYGIQNHPISIRNFAFYIKKNWTRPEYIFIIGKGIAYDILRNSADSIKMRSLVPPFGTPGSDDLLFSKNDSSVPLFNVGRLSAENPRSIFNYLEKVKTYESSLRAPRTVKDLGWRKRIIHLSGGGVDEQAVIRGFLKPMENAALNNQLGIETRIFEKTNSDPVATSVSEAVIKAVEDGVLIKTFFGHGGVTNTDFGLDNPDFFNNQERYPLIFSLGCLTGNLFTRETSVSEAFIRTEKKGAVAYIASSGYGYIHALSDFATTYYQLFGDTMYARPLGAVTKVVREKFDAYNNSVAHRSLVQQLTFHGDPALRLSDYAGPDFAIDPASVKHQPAVVNTQNDSIQINFELVNLEAVQDNRVPLLIEHELPDGKKNVYADTVLVDRAFVDVSFKIPLPGKPARGNNKIRILIDRDNQIAEQPPVEGEQNNRLQFENGQDFYSFFVIDNDISPVYPPDWGIVDEDKLVLRATPTDIFAKLPQTYIFQLDTSARFDSPLRHQFSIQKQNGIVEWKPENFPWQDSTVYYWRVRMENGPVADNWNQRSFLFLKNRTSPGWHQSHYYQWLQNGFSTIELDSSDRDFRFARDLRSVIGDAMVLSPTNNQISRLLFDNERIFRQPVRSGATLGFCFYDPEAGTFLECTSQRRLGALNNSTFGFCYRANTAAEREKVMSVLKDSIPDGYYVVLLTYQNDWNQTFSPELWAADSVQSGTNLFQLFEAQGATKIRQLESAGSVPYAFAYIKNGGPVAEDIALDGDEVANVLFEVPGRWDRGEIVSKLAGPAKSWRSVHWLLDAVEIQDSIKISLLGYAAQNATPEVLIENLTPADTSLAGIDARVYPFLQLKFAALDSLNRTCPQLEKWEILYEGFADAVVQPLNFYADSIQQGDKLVFETNLLNASLDASLDSVLIHFTLKSADNRENAESTTTAPLAAGDSLRLNFQYDTRSLSGLQEFKVEANPGPEQPETNYFNNAGVRNFFVKSDHLQPVLDVTFDGQHILNGDIVSPKPFILMTLKDENPFLWLSDTSVFQIALQHPGGQSEQLYFNSPDIQFFAADSVNGINKARVEYRPVLPVDGTYNLMVNGRDASGVRAGSFDYKVEFQVINESMISDLLPYPNPFSTATRFLYTLTGDEAPADMKIQIMTVSGRVVREIGRAEFGEMRTGTHLSDFVWDGTDMYGDRLANGVYLYRVVVRDATKQALKKYENAATGQFFRNEYGKIVLLK